MNERTLREPEIVEYRFGGESLYVPDHLVEVFDDVVATLRLAERAAPPTPEDMLDWSRMLRLEAARLERSHQAGASALRERAEGLYRQATVLQHASVALLGRRGTVVKRATRKAKAGDRVFIHPDGERYRLDPGTWVVEDVFGCVSVTKLDALGRRTGVGRTWRGDWFDAGCLLSHAGVPMIRVMPAGEVTA